jgi:hypothetical protein
MKNKIKLIDEIKNKTFTRKSISSIFKKINSIRWKKIFVDFKDVINLSKESAEEYLKNKEESCKDIYEINLSKDVFSMFKLVEKK